MENCTVCKNTVQMKNEGDGSCNCIDPNSYFDLDTSFCVCNNGFFAENYACSQCSSGCAVCAASNICNTCYDPENTVNSDTGSCVCSDPNAAFDPSSLVCACKSGFYNDNNVCTACNYGCAECTNYDDCQMCLDPPRMENTGRGICYCRDPLSVLDDKSKTCQCESGTYNNTDCIECNPTCANCTSAEECQDCHDPENMVNNNDGHCYCKIENDFYNQSSQACDKCGMGTYSNNDGLTCSMCALGCMYCDSIDNCIQCYDSNSVKDVNGKCECNDPNARFDNIDNQCVCADGYFDNGGALCAPCNTGCATCTNTTSCTECWEPYETENQGNGICSCVNITLFYDVIQHECEVCPEGSHSKGDGLNCVNCGQGCEICDAPTECTQCFDMNHMIFDGGNCTCMDMNAYFNTTTNLCECLEGYYENGDVCIECKQGCAVCQSENVCSQCFDPTRTQILTDGTCSCKDLDAFFNIQSKQCECEIGYYPSGTNCQTCSFGCAECQTGLQCNACYDPTRTINEGDGTCKCSDTNSNFVAATDNCQCKAGYFYNNNICTPCQLTCEQCLSFNTCNYCFDTNHMVNTNNGSCSCKDPHAVFNSTIKLCTCTDGY